MFEVIVSRSPFTLHVPSTTFVAGERGGGDSDGGLGCIIGYPGGTGLYGGWDGFGNIGGMGGNDGG